MKRSLEKQTTHKSPANSVEQYKVYNSSNGHWKHSKYSLASGIFQYYL